jgi:hypothetical protein
VIFIFFRILIRQKVNQTTEIMKYLLLNILVCIFVLLDYKCSSFFLSKCSSLGYQYKVSNLESSNDGFDDDFFTNPNTISKGFLPTAFLKKDSMTIQELCSIKWLLHFKSNAAEELKSPSKFFTKFDDDFRLYTNDLGTMMWKFTEDENGKQCVAIGDIFI